VKRVLAQVPAGDPGPGGRLAADRAAVSDEPGAGADLHRSQAQRESKALLSPGAFDCL